MADMSQWVSHDCPNCGASLKIAPEAVRIKCPYCESMFTRDTSVIRDDPNKIDFSGDTIKMDAPPAWDYSGKFEQTSDFKPTMGAGEIDGNDIKPENPQDQILEEEIDKLAEEAEKDNHQSIDILSKIKEIPVAKMIILAFAAILIMWVLSKAFAITADLLNNINSVDVEDINSIFY